ncbi:MAG: Smr/MutS family protein [Acidobacteriota bacterium]
MIPEDPPAETRRDAALRHALDVLDWAALLDALAGRCATLAGAELARAAVPRPHLAEALDLLTETEEGRRLLQDERPPPLSGVRAVSEQVDAARRGMVLEPGELSEIARSLEGIDGLARYLERRGDLAPALAERGERLVRAPELVEAIDAVVDSRGRVRDDASPTLRQLQKRRSRVASRIEERLDGLRRQSTVSAALSGDNFTVRHDRYVLPVRSDRRQAVRGILHGRSQSGHSLFVEPEAVIELNNDLSTVALEIEEEKQRLLRELSSEVGARAEELTQSLDEHRHLDLAIARARLAEELGARRPVLQSEGPLELELSGLGHPLLLLTMEPSAVIRNDVELAPPLAGVVLSGPNAGGKTVLLKSIALACLMPAIGLPVVAEPGARVPWIESVVADIGDEQSIASSLSTFSAHLVRVADALVLARESRCLVLLDELMVGTDPDEGSALAQAVIEQLVQGQGFFVVTTHLGRLKVFASQREELASGGMELDPETLESTYRLRLGIPGASAATSLAERMGLPEGVLTRTRELVGAEGLRLEALIAELDGARAATRMAQAEAEGLRDELARKTTELDERLAAVARADEELVGHERRRFEAELTQLREEAARITKELQAKPSLPAAQDAINRLKDLKVQARETQPAGASRAAGGSTGAPDLRVGATVGSKSMGRDGEIIGGGGTRWKVRFGHVTVQLASSDLTAPGGGRVEEEDAAVPGLGRKLRKRQRRAARAASAATGSAAVAEGSDEEVLAFVPQGDHNTCDLRGERVEAALAKMTSFLATCERGGQRQVIVIHGHGTGVLKQAVREELTHEARVSQFRAGGDGEGGDGVTVVALR